VNHGSPHISHAAPPFRNANTKRLRKATRGKDVGPTRGFAASPGVGPSATVGTLRIGYPRVQASSQDNGSRLPAKGSSEAATCPHSSGSRSQLGAAPGPPRIPTAWAPAHDSGQLQGHHVSPRLGLPLPAWGSSGATTCPRGSAGCRQINKYPLTTRPS
jgi:hypothetical protein